MLILTTFVCIPISYVELAKKIMCSVSWSLFKQEFMVYLFVFEIDSGVVTLEQSDKSLECAMTLLREEQFVI